MRRITVDIETINATVGGGFDPNDMKLAVACIHDSETNEYTSYKEEELPNLWPILERADVIIGYNSDHFDIPILNKYYTGDLSTIHSVDLLSKIREALGRRIKLDSVAEATLGRKKSGSGLDAIKWWLNGEEEKVIKYCIEDVRITKEIYEYALQNGKIRFSDLGKKRDVSLDTSDWEVPDPSALTHTLPF